MYFLRGSRSVRVSGVGVRMSPRSITVRPMVVSRSPIPAMRTADGPISTPRRPLPRSSGTPMMWTARAGVGIRRYYRPAADVLRYGGSLSCRWAYFDQGFGRRPKGGGRVPIFVRPVREQLEHDRLIRFLQGRYKRKFEVAISVGDEQLAPVKVGPLTLFPDLVLTDGKRL